MDKFLHTDPAYLNSINEGDRSRAVAAVAAAADRPAGQQHVLLGDQPVDHPACLRRKEPQGGAEGRGVRGLPQDHDPADHRCAGRDLRAGLSGQDWGNGNSAYPMLVAEVMPKPVLGFFAAVMFGAILSSFNSVLNSHRRFTALDIHRPDLQPDRVGFTYGQDRPELRHHRRCDLDGHEPVHALYVRHHDLCQLDVCGLQHPDFCPACCAASSGSACRPTQPRSSSRCMWCCMSFCSSACATSSRRCMISTTCISPRSCRV